MAHCTSGAEQVRQMKCFTCSGWCRMGLCFAEIGGAFGEILQKSRSSDRNSHSESVWEVVEVLQALCSRSAGQKCGRQTWCKFQRSSGSRLVPRWGWKVKMFQLHAAWNWRLWIYYTISLCQTCSSSFRLFHHLHMVFTHLSPQEAKSCWAPWLGACCCGICILARSWKSSEDIEVALKLEMIGSVFKVRSKDLTKAYITYRFITYEHLSSQLAGFLQLNWTSTEDVVRVCWQRSQALSACRDRVIRFWKLETGELLGFEKQPRTILINLGRPGTFFSIDKLGTSVSLVALGSRKVCQSEVSIDQLHSCPPVSDTDTHMLHVFCSSFCPSACRFLPVWSCRYLRGYLHSFVLMDAAARLGSFFLVCLNSISPRCSLLRGHTSSVCCLLVNWDLRREAWLDRMDKQVVSRKV